MRFINKKAYPLIVIILIFVLFYIIGSKIPEETIRDFVTKAGPFGPILLIFLFWSSNIVAPLSGAPYLFVGFYLFGNMVMVYSLTAAFFASISNYWIAKIWGRKIVEKLAGIDGLKKIDSLAENYGPKTLFIFRLILWQYHDVVSYAFGLTKINFTQYLIITIVGMTPGSLLWYFLSSKITNAVTFTVLTFIMASVSLTACVFWSKTIKKRKNE